MLAKWLALFSNASWLLIIHVREECANMVWNVTTLQLSTLVNKELFPGHIFITITDTKDTPSPRTTSPTPPLPMQSRFSEVRELGGKQWISEERRWGSVVQSRRQRDTERDVYRGMKGGESALYLFFSLFLARSGCQEPPRRSGMPRQDEMCLKWDKLVGWSSQGSSEDQFASASLWMCECVCVFMCLPY